MAYFELSNDNKLDKFVGENVPFYKRDQNEQENRRYKFVGRCLVRLANAGRDQDTSGHPFPNDVETKLYSAMDVLFNH